MSEPFVGEIKAFGFNFAPRGWAFCDGQLLAIAQNDALFSLLGTIYGGDGRTTFGLPDLRGRTPLHLGTGPGLSPRPWGQRSGQESVVLNVNQLPAHSHAQNATPAGTGKMRAVNVAPTGNDPTGSTLGMAAAYSSDTPAVDMAAGSVVLDPIPHPNTNNAGASQSHNNLPPYLVISYCIALTGIYPSRS